MVKSGAEISALRITSITLVAHTTPSELATSALIPQPKPKQPRAIGAGMVSVQADPLGASRILGLRQSGSTKLVFPQAFRSSLEAILVNTAGGITGGDVFSLDIDIKEGAELTLTTQTAERAYRAQPGEVGQVTTTISVGPMGRMNWLPQELILFETSSLERDLSIQLARDAQLLMVEPIVFGRAAMDETLTNIHFRDRISIHRDGRPVYLDAMTLQGDATAHLAKPAVANGAGAMASVVLVRPDAQTHLAASRKILPTNAGATMIADDVLIIRHLATDAYILRRDLMPLLEHLSDTPLPTSWRL